MSKFLSGEGLPVTGHEFQIEPVIPIIDEDPYGYMGPEEAEEERRADEIERMANDRFRRERKIHRG